MTTPAEAEAGLPADVAEAGAALERLGRQRPTLAGHARLLAELLPVLFSGPVTGSLALSAAQAAAKLSQGIPLLRGENISFDHARFRARWQAICAALARQSGGEAACSLAQALADGKLKAEAMVQAVCAGQPETLHQHAAAWQLEAGLAASVLRWTLFPMLAHWQTTLAPLVAANRWEHGCCPVCGSWPLLSELRGQEQFLHLRCGLCTAAWEFPRLLCPFCGNRDHRRLGYFHVEGEEARQRVAVCDVCRGYVKTVATLAPLSGPHLLVADVATLHLDLAAAERGYSVT